MFGLTASIPCEEAEDRNPVAGVEEEPVQQLTLARAEQEVCLFGDGKPRVPLRERVGSPVLLLGAKPETLT